MMRYQVGLEPRPAEPHVVVMVPYCAICERQVDKFVRDDEPYKAQTIYIALCHGERDEVVLTAEALRAAEVWVMRCAFEPASELPPAPPPLVVAPPRMGGPLFLLAANPIEPDEP